MKTPKVIAEMVKNAVSESKTAQESIEIIIGQITNCPEATRDWVEFILRKAVESLVYEHRRELNRSLKTKGYVAVASKINWAESKVVQNIYTVYEFKIAGRNLGDIMGSELETILEQERNSIRGHELNVEFLSRLQKKVPPNKTVKEAINLKTITRIFNSVYAPSSNGEQ